MIKVNSETDKVCVAKAQEAGQAHLFENWDDLDQDEQRKLIEDLRSVNYQLVKRLLHQSRQGKSPEIDLGMLAAPEIEQLPETPASIDGDGDCFKNARQAL